MDKKNLLERRYMESRLQNIKKQEEAFIALRASLKKLDGIIAEWENNKESYQTLVKYYQSEEWIEDYEADNRGEYKLDTSGVLSQDAVYDFLEHQHRVSLRIMKVALSYLDN